VNEVLAGVRVLDLTNALAASSATKILADLGAEVIKIENPAGGDYTRALMPYIFESHNRNKRSFAVDLKHPEGVALVKQVATTCDVLVQSMRPGAAREVGLSAEDLAVVNPNLIYASFSAFGPTGPDAHRRGVDGVAQAESGLASLQNGVLGGTSFVDTTAGLALSQAILIALMKRDRFGVVEPVDVCLLDTAVYMQAAPIAEFSVEGVVVDQKGYPSRYALAGVYEAADGPFFMAPYWERDWQALCAILGRTDLRTHARFADRAARGEHVVELRELLGKEFARRPRLEWLAELEGDGVLAGIVRSYADVLDDPQLRANQALEQHVLTDGRTAVFPRAPFRFAGQPLESTRSAPELGADTAGLLAEIGVDTARVDHLYEAGVITGERPK
jgi:crotonobetainyl-CoA:carnitine CoA-transferase CaiB-like acyl-CoA transferase